MDRLTGKIKWFSRDRRSGVLASVGGISLGFTHSEAGAFTQGQIVTYEHVEETPLGQGACDVRAQA